VSRRVTIDPITRLEGHGRIEIFLDEAGEVENAYFQVPELRGFEAFCRGRMAEEMPVITNRICGVCPEAHHMAASKALDALYRCPPGSAARKVRELLYSAFFVTDHATHFYVLGGPDFIVGPDAPPGERNLLGVVRKVGAAFGLQVIGCRKRNHHVIQAIGGRGIHPAAGLPGGWAKPVSESTRAEAEKAARENIAFAELSLATFDQIVLQDGGLRELVMGDLYLHHTHSMGTVDAQGRPNFYDGDIRVVDIDGAELLRYPARDYHRHVAERTEPWSYVKFPYLRARGWKGLVDGNDSGIYVASPLSRLNVATGMATPRAQEHFERFYAAFGSRRRPDGGFAPVHHRLATHWARLIEMLYASERMLELATDPEITSPDVRRVADAGVDPKGGVGSVEAPRGTLTHHYEADERGVLTRVNLLVGTTNNAAAMAMSVKRAAQGLIGRGKAITQGILNRIEMAFRVYDPCLSCATHALPGQAPLVLTVHDAGGEVVDRVVRD
jgi:F420-non-reducing hydrogenase large subunit